MLRSIYKYLGISLEKIVIPKEYNDLLKGHISGGLRKAKSNYPNCQRDFDCIIG